MRRLKQKIFTYFFDIRPEEFRLVQIFFMYYICIGMFITVGFTTADSLFLTRVPPEKIRLLYAWGHLGIAVVTIIVTWFYRQVLDKIPRIHLLIWMQLFFLISLFLLRQAISSDLDQGSVGLYFLLVIWIKVCGQISMLLFFSFAGDYFTTHAAKRVYPYIMSGLTLGSIAAGALISRIVPRIGSENMLYVCEGLLIAEIGCIVSIYKIGTAVNWTVFSTKIPKKTQCYLNLILGKPYIIFLFLAALLGVLCFILLDIQMKITAKDIYLKSPDLAAFFGLFYGYAGITTLLFQVLGVKFLLHRVGIIPCLMILPSFHLVMSLTYYSTGYGFFPAQTFLIITTANFLRIVLTESLDLPSREILFLPLPFSLRIRAQTMMGGLVEPLGQGIGGILLMSLSAFGISLTHYSLFIVFFAILWLIILVLERSKYRDALFSSLKNNQFERSELRKVFQGSDVDFILEEMLRKADEQLVSFALDLFRYRSIEKFSSAIQALAVGKNPELAVKAIELLGKDGDTAHLDTLKQACFSEIETVREAAVLAWCQIQQDEAIARVHEWMKSSDPVIRQAALIGCGKYCGENGGQLVHPVLAHKAASSQPEERRAAADLIGKMHNTTYGALLTTLLDDSEHTVRLAAINACAHMTTPELVSKLLQLYRLPEMQAVILTILERLPEEYMPLIAEALQDTVPPGDTQRERLLHILASIGGEEAERILWEYVTGDFPVVIRVAAGQSLHKLLASETFRTAQETTCQQSLSDLTERMKLLNQACLEIGASDDFTWQLLKDHAGLEIECLFLLLAVTYHLPQIDKVRYNFFSSSPVHQANALELLDDMLPRRVASEIIAILDAFLEKPSSSHAGLSDQVIQHLFAQEEWLRVITRSHVNRRASESQIPGVSSLSEYGQGLYRLLEKILFLKKVPLFHEVPGNYLIPLAQIAQPILLHDSEMLFSQGDMGRSLYLIRDGVIRVVIDNVEVVRRGIGECIGEMAILDGMPRSASCIAAERTVLFAIAARDFETIIRTQPGVTLAVLRTLARRLRQQTIQIVQQEGEERVQRSPRQASERPLAPPASSSIVTDSSSEIDVLDPSQALYSRLKKISFLRNVPLFKELPEQYLVPLADIARVKYMNAGSSLFNQGERGDALYIICSGTISIRVNKIEVNQVGEGECIGEMALLDGSPRSATCIAREDTELLMVNERDFEIMLKSQTSVAYAMLHTLVARLRRQSLNKTQQ